VVFLFFSWACIGRMYAYPTAAQINQQDLCADIMFILEESEMLYGEYDEEWGTHAWDTMKDYMISMVDKFPIGQQHTRFAVVGFGTIGVSQLRFEESTNAEDLKTKIKNIEVLCKNPSNCARNTSDGYEKAYAEFLSSSRNNVPKYAIFVEVYASDQTTEDQVLVSASKLRDLNVYLYMVPMIDFKYDVVFRKEIDDTHARFGDQHSVVLELNNYDYLQNSTLTEMVQARTQSESQCGKERRIA